MKSVLLIVALALSIGATFTGCSPDKEQKMPVDAAPQDKTSIVYECPMQCEGSSSGEPGKCKVCGMELEKKK